MLVEAYEDIVWQKNPSRFRDSEMEILDEGRMIAHQHGKTRLTEVRILHENTDV